MALSPLLSSAAAFFAAEPAAVSLTAELGDEFVAVVRTADGAAAIGTFATEEAALAALEAHKNRETIRELMTAYDAHTVHNHYASTDIDPACNICTLAVAFRPLDLEGVK